MAAQQSRPYAPSQDCLENSLSSDADDKQMLVQLIKSCDAWTGVSDVCAALLKRECLNYSNIYGRRDREVSKCEDNIYGNKKPNIATYGNKDGFVDEENFSDKTFECNVAEIVINALLCHKFVGNLSI